MTEVPDEIDGVLVDLTAVDFSDFSVLDETCVAASLQRVLYDVDHPRGAIIGYETEALLPPGRVPAYGASSDGRRRLKRIASTGTLTPETGARPTGGPMLARMLDSRTRRAQFRRPGTGIHCLSGAQFVGLASGHGDKGTLETLLAAQSSKRMLLLWNLVETVLERVQDTAIRECVTECFALLAAARRESPEAVDTVLLYPTVGTWMVHCLRRIRGVRQCPGEIEDDLGHLGGIAVAAAFRACLGFDVPVRIRQGTVMFPTFGMAQVGGDTAWGRVHGSSGEETVTVVLRATDVDVPLTSDATGGVWLPSRRCVSLVAGSRVDVIIEDADPYRGCGAFEVDTRLDAATTIAWQNTIDAAWEVLAQRHAHRVPSIATVVSCLIPLRAAIEGTTSSATSSEAIGAVVMTPPAGPVDLALTLVHEVQHLKLASLLDLVRLHSAPTDAVHYAPWRSDPRPIGGLLHGAYAFLGVAGFWYERWTGEQGGAALAASFEFAWSRDAVFQVVTTLLESGALTSLGCRFVAGMADQVARWRDAPVPLDAAECARAMAADTWTAWRLRNLCPDQAHIAGWADAWLAGRPCPGPEAPATRIVNGGHHPARPARFGLTYLRLNDEQAFRRLEFPIVYVPRVTEADIAYVDGDLDRAALLFKARLARHPACIASFAGLALTRLESATPQAQIYVDHPEALRALTMRLGELTGSGPDPDELARWIAVGR